MSIVAMNAKLIMERRGLRQGYVAAAAGYDCKKFSNMMCGRKVITDEDVFKISKALNVPPNELFRVDESKIG